MIRFRKINKEKNNFSIYSNFVHFLDEIVVERDKNISMFISAIQCNFWSVPPGNKKYIFIVQDQWKLPMFPHGSKLGQKAISVIVSKPVFI